MWAMSVGRCVSLCVRHCDPMYWSPSGSSAHGILQGRILEWLAIPCSKGFSWPRDQIHISCIADGFFTSWATGETQEPHLTTWTLWERERVGRFGRMALKHVYYHVWNESPVQVRCTILDAWGWCTGTTQRDGKGREEGGGFRMGNTCISVADSFRYLAKPIQYCKV